MLKANWGGTGSVRRRFLRDDRREREKRHRAGRAVMLVSGGLFFDVEQQTGDVWAFPRATDTHTFDRLWGRKPFSGVASSWPPSLRPPRRTTILMNVATTEVFRSVCMAGGALEQDEYQGSPPSVHRRNAGGPRPGARTGADRRRLRLGLGDAETRGRSPSSTRSYTGTGRPRRRAGRLISSAIAILWARSRGPPLLQSPAPRRCSRS